MAMNRSGPMQALELGVLREVAQLSLSAVPRPFLRWAGSKRALLPWIVDVLPESFRTYYEPFMGSGALFFLLQPRNAHLSDTCDELVATYQAVKANPAAVLRYLRPMRPSEELFYQIRANRSRAPYKGAAEFIHLNKTCWNGLYRVNSHGQFNVPYGLPKTATIVEEDVIAACAECLYSESVALACHDFEVALQSVESGDLVFLDPPYVTRHNNNGFIDYNERLFSWSDQLRLAAKEHPADRARAPCHYISA